MSRALSFETTHGSLRFTIEESEVIHLDTSKRKKNVKIIALLLESWMCLLADSPLNAGRRSQKPAREFAHFKRDFLVGPLKDFVLAYASYSHSIVSSTLLMGSGSVTGDWIPEMKNTPVFKEYLEWYRTGDPVMLQFVYTFLNFGKKLSYTDPELNTTALRGWEKVEERLSELRLEAVHLAGMAKVLSGLIPSYRRVPLKPKFGPGRVAEQGVFGAIAKSNKIAFDSKIDRMFFRGHFANYGLSAELGYHPDKILPDPTVWSPASGVSGRSSRVKFVPKDVKTTRTICMEPNVYMFAQQAVLDRLLHAIEDGPARRFIDIQNQARNKELAWYGSISGEIDTIDLSSASDSVSVELVKGIFPREVLYDLLATRTSSVLTPDGKTRSVRKFAPMGSALCFPVQCLVFTAMVVYAAIQRTHGLEAGDGVPLDSPWLADIERTVDTLFHRYIPVSPHVNGYRHRPGRRKFEPAAVYGDVICVDQQLTSYVTSLLSLFGFEVNHSKSFTGSQAFRESCGGFYWNGEDVTPLYFRVKQFSGNVMPPESVASMVACANNAGDRMLRNLRRHLIHRLLGDQMEGITQYHGVNPFLFSSDRTRTHVDNPRLSYAIYSHSPRNTHLGTRYEPNYQRDEYRCIMILARDRIECRDFESPALERYLHLRWWGSRTGVVSFGFTSGASRFDASGTRLRRVWVPA